MLLSYVFCFLQLEFYTYLPKQKRNTKSSSNPFNAKISFEAYLLIPVAKAEEGHYKSYNLQGVHLYTLSFCCCWDRCWGALTHFYFLTSLNKKEICFLYDNYCPFLYDHFSDQMVIRQNLCLKCILPFQTIFLPCH